VYYLEDFHQLIRALPRVRPHIFFSVPRFYEKVWQEWSKRVPGRWYQARPEHWTRRLSAPLWGRMLRRRVGLHHCAQMIVGSAPCSSSLLRGFQALGIQVHNAYGLTEAPLITMNRAGANRIDTVGPPLPSTHVNMAEDNEVLARGPQVAAGYVTGGTLHPFQTQWLHTGDIGRIDPDGHLILCGRKGDQLITAYGKNIDPAAMECRLREIPGIIDATVLGEGRPYLVALIWLQESHPDARLFDFWDGAIERINRDFSHPEQIKRWAFVDQPLSVAAGHLTPTLKLRREVVRRQWGTIVESLYHGIQSPGMLHVGKART